MTKFAILTSNEQHRFDAPPIFTSDERALYFALANDEMKLIQELRTPSNKVGFILQMGYFKANAKFFTAEQFRRQDIEYAASVLGITSAEVNLSSYQKKIPTDHRKRILEFGRIIKSIFILTYFDDVELRQRIEKQLNKIELSNKFSKAILFANNQEFKQGTKEAQEIATACIVLIQNAILLWSYLYLSQILVNNADAKERTQMINSIKRSSMMFWGHVTKPAANDIPFDMEKILALRVA